MYEEIRAEIVRQKDRAKDMGSIYWAGRTDLCEELLAFIKFIQPSEEKPPKYDKEYLDEKIKKATRSWNGVDVDAFLAECRGYEKPSEDLEKEIDRYEDEMHGFESSSRDDCINIARHFAQWQKEQMMKGAVVEVVQDASEDIEPWLVVDVGKFGVKHGDKVKIIIIKEDE